MSEQVFDPRAEVLERFGFARHLFTADIHSMTEEDLGATCGGQSRCGYDFMFELIGFYETFSKLLVAGPQEIEGPQGGWVRAPKEFCHKESAMASLAAAEDKFVSVVKDYSGNFVADIFPSPVGPFTPLGICNLAVWHTMYHSGQLNYIQTIKGDVDFHWMDDSN